MALHVSYCVAAYFFVARPLPFSPPIERLFEFLNGLR